MPVLSESRARKLLGAIEAAKSSHTGAWQQLAARAWRSAVEAVSPPSETLSPPSEGLSPPSEGWFPPSEGLSPPSDPEGLET